MAAHSMSELVQAERSISELIAKYAKLRDMVNSNVPVEDVLRELGYPDSVVEKWSQASRNEGDL